jgi:hypothetical protein
LQTAIDTTSDSLELSKSDVNTRAADIKTTDDKDEKEREAAMKPREVQEKKKQQAAAEEKKKKQPTLMRPGEKPPQ